VVGYKIIEGWNFIDSLYMVIITLATVGYGETHPLSTEGRLFTIFLIISGSGLLVYALTTITTFIVEGEFGKIIRRKKMDKKIKQMSGHYIICGAGRTGINVISELLKSGHKFVVIDNDIHRIESLEIEDLIYIVGSATHEQTLIDAGIERAAGLASCLPNDGDNLYVVFTARSLNPDIRIVSRCIEEEAISKLKKGGADAVVSPNIIGGLRIASELIRPTVVSFLDTMLRVGKGNLRVEEATIGNTSHYAGRSIMELKIKEKTGLLILAIKKKEGKYIFNPSINEVVDGGDTIIVMGEMEGVHSLKKMLE